MDRPEDVPALVRHFLLELPPAAATDLGIPGDRQGRWRVTSRAMSALQRHPWPGNARELAQVLGRLARRLAPHETVIRSGMVATELGAPAGEPAAVSPLSDHTASYVASALESCKGNLSLAAKALGISRARIRRILGR